MKPNADITVTHFISGIVALVFIAGLILCLHAFADANRHRLDTEKLYNTQPRVKPLRSRLKWPGRFLSFFTSR